METPAATPPPLTPSHSGSLGTPHGSGWSSLQAYRKSGRSRLECVLHSEAYGTFLYPSRYSINKFCTSLHLQHPDWPQISHIFNLNYSYGVNNNVSGLKPQGQGSGTRKYVLTGRNLKQNHVVLRHSGFCYEPATHSTWFWTVKKVALPKVHIQSASGGEVMAATPLGTCRR